MPLTMKELLNQYVAELKSVYGRHLKAVILYGSYARGDYNKDSDIDIMILLDLEELDIKSYRHALLEMTYDFNMNYELDIKPIVKNEEHFRNWIDAYPFYSNVEKEGVKLFEAA